MGLYLNSKKPCTLYQRNAKGEYFIDKTMMLEEVISLIEQGGKYTCITRPRRFGKTMMANMIGAFLGKGKDCRTLFQKLKIGTSAKFETHIHNHEVIYIACNEVPKNCNTYEQYRTRIENILVKELLIAYPNLDIEKDTALWDILNSIHEEEDVQFVFVFDEWDYIFHRDYVTEQDRKSYMEFLSSLLKDQPYVSYAYMTGILPIAKYSSGSELNMFLEYTMASEEKYSEYFGFTETEVDELFRKYVIQNSNPNITREELRLWYDGYHTRSGERVYNPRSVVAALSNNNLGNYWTSAGPYDEIFYYIEKNVADVRADLARMVSGMCVSAKVREYAATSMNLKTKNEIFSAMVVYGFLSYEDGTVAGDTRTMLKILEYAHDTEIPLLSYNNETDLTAVVNLVYLSARDFYRIEREDKAGIGYVDFIFYPETEKTMDCIIIELKVDHTPEEAIQQIKDRKYALRFHGKLGEDKRYTGKILGVGITYDRKSKKHDCKVEILE